MSWFSSIVTGSIINAPYRTPEIRATATTFEPYRSQGDLHRLDLAKTRFTAFFHVVCIFSLTAAECLSWGNLTERPRLLRFLSMACEARPNVRRRTEKRAPQQLKCA